MVDLELEGVSKTFQRGGVTTRAVDGVSFNARGGEVFGLLGPNGAGKTTLIRMLLDILRPDVGAIRVDGATPGNRGVAFRRRVGYLPEERGLYRKRKVLDVLVYLGALKGLARARARAVGMELLGRFALGDCAYRKVETLSKGMAQKLQIASCVMHDPDIVVFDEPFSGLDPVNVRLVRDLILGMKARGRLVLLSTHMMSEVEVLCDRIVLIHRGRALLFGPLDHIKRTHTDYQAVVDAQAAPEDLPCVERVAAAADGKHVYLKPGATLTDLMREMGQAGRSVRRLEEGLKPIEDIFVDLVGQEATAAASPSVMPAEGASS